MDDGKPAREAAAPADSGYLKALTRYGDRNSLRVAQPIYSATGIKLLEAGVRVDSRVFERLFHHRLAEPIDRCLAADDTLRARDLPEAAQAAVAALPALERTLGRENLARRAAAAMRDCGLPPTMAIRLTVARAEAPELYAHSLRAAWLACYIGAAAQVSDRELETLAMAALLHDIGMLHVDPAVLNQDKPLTVEARRLLQAHPITAAMVVRSEPALSPSVAAAVEQHHERVDGTGYPRGVQGDSIGRLARILMLVEVALAVFEHQTDVPELQLSLILRLNHRSFDRGLSELLLSLLPRVSVSSRPEPSNAASLLAQLFADWEPAAATAEAGETAARDHIAEQLGRLRRMLEEAGYPVTATGDEAPDDDAMVQA